jgi:hypothetical protein
MLPRDDRERKWIVFNHWILHFRPVRVPAKTQRWGFYLLALVSFWFVWANMMTTVNSLRFEKPKITLNWFIVFPFGILVGLAYIAWTLIHFDTIYLR